MTRPANQTNACRRLAASRLIADGETHFITWRLADRQPGLAPEERDLVAAALRHFDGHRYNLHAWVVMDDHVHVVVSPIGSATMQSILSTWRRFTARALSENGLRCPPVWQRGFYDRVVWADGELAEKISYVRGNPWKRWPELGIYRWVSGDSR